MSVSLKIFFQQSQQANRYLKVLLYTVRKVRYSEGFALHCQKSTLFWRFCSTLPEKSLKLNAFLYTVRKDRYFEVFFLYIVRKIVICKLYTVQYSSGYWIAPIFVLWSRCQICFSYFLSPFRICFLKSTAFDTDPQFGFFGVTFTIFSL